MEAPAALMARFGSMPAPELRRHLEDQFLEKTVEELVKYECTEGHIQPPVMTRTAVFFHEWKVARWVRNINEEVGTAPGYDEIERLNEDLGGNVRATQDKGPVQQQATKKRLSRWRRRWLGKLGRVHTQGGGSVDCVSGKAGFFFRWKHCFWHESWDPVLGPLSGPLKAQNSGVVCKTGPIFWVPNGARRKPIFVCPGSDVLDAVEFGREHCSQKWTPRSPLQH